jgi:hypothetical protein
LIKELASVRHAVLVRPKPRILQQIGPPKNLGQASDLAIVSTG